MDGRSDLMRFVMAQNVENFIPGETVYMSAHREIAGGRKRGCWMWFIYPQLRGLGSSFESDYYGLADAAEARAYARHPVLGERLRDMCRLVLMLPPGDPTAVFGGIDAMKLRSSMTLFAAAVPEEALFRQVLAHCFDGLTDERTLMMLNDK